MTNIGVNPYEVVQCQITAIDGNGATDAQSLTAVVGPLCAETDCDFAIDLGLEQAEFVTVTADTFIHGLTQH